MRMDRILKGMSAVLTALAVVVVLTVPAEASQGPEMVWSWDASWCRHLRQPDS